MRNKKGQFVKGHKPPKSPGRPKRADEQVLVDLWNSDGQRVFKKAVKEGKDWAIKILMNKLFADKKATEHTGKDGGPIEIKWLK